MRAIAIYEAKDGSRFDGAEDCSNYEGLCASIERALEPIGECPKLEHGRYKQHPPSAALAAAHAVTALAVEWCIPSRANEQWHPHSMIQRYVDDSNNKALNQAMFRINCINLETGREYDQPYFRLHPEEAKEQEL